MQWLFERMGVLKIHSSLVSNQDDFTLIAIDVGAQDISFEQDGVFVYVEAHNTQNAQLMLSEKGYPSEASLAWIAKDLVKTSPATQKTLQRIFESLNDHDDVQELYTNAD